MAASLVDTLVHHLHVDDLPATLAVLLGRLLPLGLQVSDDMLEVFFFYPLLLGGKVRGRDGGREDEGREGGREGERGREGEEEEGKMERINARGSKRLQNVYLLTQYWSYSTPDARVLLMVAEREITQSQKGAEPP